MDQIALEHISKNATLPNEMWMNKNFYFQK